MANCLYAEGCIEELYHMNRRIRISAITSSFFALVLIAFSFVSPERGLAASSILHPFAYITTVGSSGGQAFSALTSRDQSGAQDNWNRYVEFLTPGVAYNGYRRYRLPSTIAPLSITSIQVRANYKGPLKAEQTWRWRIYDWRNSQWVTLGDNANSNGWSSWTFVTFGASGRLANYVSSTRELRIQLISNSAVDNLDLDYEAIVINTSVTNTPTPTDPPVDRWVPALNTSWQLQLSGTIDTSLDVQMYDIDGEEGDLVPSLHARGIYVVCYFSAGSYENYRTDTDDFPDSVLGNTLAGWPDERWLDIRRIGTLAPIMRARMDRCRDDGFDAIDPDNVDGYTNNTGFPLTAQDQLAYNTWLANEAHARGMSIALKNDGAQAAQLWSVYDFALNEQCFYYNECGYLTQYFVNNGKAAFVVEYNLETSTFCPQANNRNFNALLKRLQLNAWRVACR
jgi:hypothetical protein